MGALGAKFAPKMGQSTIVLENHLKTFVSIKIDTLNPILYVISSSYKHVRRYGGF